MYLGLAVQATVALWQAQGVGGSGWETEMHLLFVAVSLKFLILHNLPLNYFVQLELKKNLHC